MGQETQGPRPRENLPRHVIEALRWTNTDKNRAQFTAWFDRHGAVFETFGTEIVLPEQEGGLQALVTIGDWILCADGNFAAMSDRLFTACLEQGTIETCEKTVTCEGAP